VLSRDDGSQKTVQLQLRHIIIIVGGNGKKYITAAILYRRLRTLLGAAVVVSVVFFFFKNIFLIYLFNIVTEKIRYNYV